MPLTVAANNRIFTEIMSIPKPEMQVLVRVDPIASIPTSINFELFDDCFIGGSRNRQRERKLSSGMIRFLSAAMKATPQVKIKWIMAEWDSVVLSGEASIIQKLLKHDQVIGYQDHLRMRSISLS